MRRELWAAREERAAPQPTPTREGWRILRACGKGAVDGTFHTCCPTAHPPHARVDSECKRWHLEHVVLHLLSHFTLGKVQVQWLFVSCRGSRSPNSPFALSRLANLTHAVAARLRLSVPLGCTSTAECCASSASNSSPADVGSGSFGAACSCHGRYTFHRPSEADIARERKLLQLRVIHLCARFGISQDRMWNLDETAVRLDPKKSRVSPCLCFARVRHGHICCKHERRHVDTDCL